jgi:predicted TIM-barrel fold metal-dependent hydrolase
MDENGVDHSVLLQGGNYGFHNHYTAEAAAKYPERFTAVGSLDPYSLYAMDIFDNLTDNLKMRAIKFELSTEWGLTGYHKDLRLDGQEFAPILKKADEKSLTVVIDMGTMKMSSFDIDGLKNIVNTYKNITFVMTHCFFPCNDGNNEKRLSYARELVSDRFIFDFSNVSIETQSEFLKNMKKTVGAEHMMWGTDLPGTLCGFSYVQLIERVTKSDIFTPSELPLVMCEKAKRVYLENR